MRGIIAKKRINKEFLTTKLTLIIIGLTAGSGLLIPATYASLHPVTSGEIADNTIQSIDIQNGQVTTADIGPGQVLTGDIADNAIQPNMERISDLIFIAPNQIGTLTLFCPDRMIINGGGYDTSADVLVFENYPPDDITWTIQAHNRGSSDTSLIGYAVCMGPMP